MARKIRCVTFDCYGTLIDWEGGIARALLAVPSLSGKPDLVRKLVARREEIEKGMIVSAPELPRGRFARRAL
jgi:FMN phosphatase YigB (HAD superfamily)